MKNFVQPGDNLTIPAPADTISGDVVIVNSLIGIAAVSAKTGEPLTISTRGVFRLVKDAEQINLGQQVYWNASGNVVTATPGTNTLIGLCTELAPAAAAFVHVKIG